MKMLICEILLATHNNKNDNYYLFDNNQVDDKKNCLGHKTSNMNERITTGFKCTR